MPARILIAGLGLSFVACGGGGRKDPGPFSTGGLVLAKPDGSPFLSDAHQGGVASRLRLVEVGWGRLVDVHDVEPDGSVDPVPTLRDVLLAENVVGDGSESVLEVDAITHEARLVIRHTYQPPAPGPPGQEGAFESALKRLTSGLPPVLPKDDDGSSPPPLSVVPRNAALYLRFDDLLDDSPEARESLPEMIRLQTGYPPSIPQPARLLFDPNHGGLKAGVFHSTRVLVDFTVSAAEVLASPSSLPLNVRGLPPSSSGPLPNASLRIPTRVDFPNGHFVLLTNFSGNPLREEGPVDGSTGELVRAWRSGNSNDANAGFLLDFDQPRLVGTWGVRIERSRNDPQGPPGSAFLVDFTFETACRATIGLDDLLQVGGGLFQVLSVRAPDAGGTITDARILARSPIRPLASAELLGRAQFLTSYREAAVPLPCWLSFDPAPREPPGRGVSSGAAVSLRFSEPMDPDTFRVFDSFRLIRGDVAQGVQPTAVDLTICSLGLTPGLQEFRLIPRRPLNNSDVSEYTLEILRGAEGVRDLSGSPLAESFDRVSFELDPTEPPVRTGGIALRFADADEVLPIGLPDLRGQVTRVDGVLVPRPVVFSSAAADRSTPLVNLMGSFGPGVVTPLSALGSKLQALWRYCDLGWRAGDETFHNIDVTGMSWSPVGGQVRSDFFREFEMRLAHSRFLPDETPAPQQQPVYPLSGLGSRGSPFADNILDDPRGRQKIVHPRGLGYRVRPSDLFTSPAGTPFMPFPMNRGGGELVTYTWRDTAVVALGGDGSPGIPLAIEVGPPLFLDQGVGSIARQGKVPSFGLPLLWEIRCYSTAGSLGLTSLEILLPIVGFSRPNFRAFSTGGFDTSGTNVIKNPDLEAFPTGGFNPSSSPPGQPTTLAADNSFYVGRLDYVVRISRAHTVWMDTGAFAPRYALPVLEPREQPQGASLVLEYRGADSFSPDAGDGPFDASGLDPYGEFEPGTVVFHGDGLWTDDISAVNGSRFLQVRLSFLNGLDTGLSPTLDSLGIAYEQ